MERINDTVKLLAADVSDQSTVILCFYTGDLPGYCAPMPRDPVPPVGVPFEDGFAATLANATLLNPAVHDGAIMIGRVDPAAPYVVSGWSFRLYAKPPASSVGTNRGSAFNSCIAMSLVAGIDGIYLISKLGVERCVLGKSVSL